MPTGLRVALRWSLKALVVVLALTVIPVLIVVLIGPALVSLMH